MANTILKLRSLICFIENKENFNIDWSLVNTNIKAKNNIHDNYIPSQGNCLAGFKEFKTKQFTIYIDISQRAHVAIGCSKRSYIKMGLTTVLWKNSQDRSAHPLSVTPRAPGNKPKPLPRATFIFLLCRWEIGS